MEHRCNVRQPHTGDVVIDDPHNGSTTVKSRNIGIGGMLVETGDTPLNLNATLTVTFNLRHRDQDTRFRLPAMVVRIMPRGTAIMFLETNRKTIRLLEQALKESAHAASRPDLRAGVRRVAEFDGDRSLRSIASR